MADKSIAWPRHVAIIMDGNGRWAKERRLPRIEGHRSGIKSVQSVVETALEKGIAYLTLYAFSMENWQRPKREVNELMRVLYLYLTREAARLHKNSTRLVAIGQLQRLPERVRGKLMKIMEETAGYSKMTLVLALSYGGRTEIMDAVASLARQRRESGGESPPVTPELFAEHLYAPDIPSPDLVIRTSGEMRLSNFLLWEAAHARLHFAPQLWPDFRGEQLVRIIGEEREKIISHGEAAR